MDGEYNARALDRCVFKVHRRKCARDFPFASFRYAALRCSLIERRNVAKGGKRRGGVRVPPENGATSCKAGDDKGHGNAVSACDEAV